MQINPHIFRGYDLRGIAGKDLTAEIVEHLGKAYGTYLINHNIATEAIVGHDCRLTSEEYKGALIRGISSTGIKIIDIGLTLVGTFYWSQYHFETKGGVMITASHNPSEYNGFKFSTDFSETMISEQIQELRNITETENYIRKEIPGTTEKRDIKEAYFSDILGRFNITKKFKVVIDPSMSTPGAFVPELLRKAGCEVVEKNCELDGNFPLGTADPTEKNVAERRSGS